LRISRASLASGLIAAALAAACLPALGQEKPESILPPGFGEQPAPTPSATVAPGQPVPQPGTPQPNLASGTVPLPGATPGPAPTPTATPTLSSAQLAQYELPAYARRSLMSVGPAGPAEGALRPDAFGRADGVWIEALMREVKAPVASRWLSIALRRALVARLDTPMRVNGADFAAERAYLLLRMGEATGARAVVQSVDSENYTVKLLQMAMQTSLANGDPGELCGLTDIAQHLAWQRNWVMARAMCLGLGGQPTQAQAAISAARRNGTMSGIDLLLAEKIAGSGASGRQAVTIEWDGVDSLNAWRYGLATAGGVAIPGELMGTVLPRVRSWQALAPQFDARSRVADAEYAAARGVFSSAALVDLYGAIDPNDDQAAAELGVARDLSAAYIAPTAQDRQDALTRLWDEPKTADGKFARLVLTARAAERMPTDLDKADAVRLIASMLTAGLDRSAQKWREKVSSGSDAWAMLALADPDSRTRYAYSDVGGYAPGGDSATFKRQMLFAGLAGLGRMNAGDIDRGARNFDVKIGAENAWTRAIDRAAVERQPGTVVLLAAIGMQTPLWRGVPPEVLYHVVAALRATGQEGTARMIAAEAIARL